MDKKYKSGYSEKHFENIKSMRIKIKDGYKYNGIELDYYVGNTGDFGTDFIDFRDAVLLLNDVMAYKEEQYQLKIKSLEEQNELLQDQIYISMGR